MQVQLIISNKSQRGQVIPVDAPEFRIGRAADCHFRSESSWVSPLHCVIQSHGDTVTIQDSGSKRGTFVNGGRISSSQELKDGDKIRIGEHLFVMCVEANAEPVTTVKPSTSLPKQESGTVFEVRLNHRSVSLTRSQLFELARKGEVLPDTVITVDGTKVFADAIDGIVFDGESSAVAAQTVYGTQQSHRTTAKNSVLRPVEDSAAAFDIANEPHAQIEWAPGRRRKVSSDLWDSDSLSQASTWVGNVANRQIVIAGSILAALCLLGVFVYFSIEPGSSYGAVRITGTLTIDGMPIAGANVTLHPRGNGQRATGITNRQGRITVTTGTDPDGRGAVPDEYDVTFAMRPVIPKEYEKTETSGLAPISVKSTGENKFDFELSPRR